jgi:hypothetical protein
VDDAQDMISSEVPGAIQVKSFNLESTNINTISLSQDGNTMIACSCPSFAQSATRCKHMFLVNRIDQILFPDIAHQQPTNQAPQSPPPTGDPEEVDRAIAM